MAKPKPKVAAVYLKNVPQAVRDLFSAACRRRGTNMTAELKRYMAEYAKKDGAIDK